MSWGWKDEEGFSTWRKEGRRFKRMHFKSQEEHAPRQKALKDPSVFVSEQISWWPWGPGGVNGEQRDRIANLG